MAKKYALKRKEESVEVGDTPYLLREMDGATRDLYMQDFSTRVDLVPTAEGKTTSRLKNQIGFQSKLVSLCLFTPEGAPVTEELINSWPALTVQGLFKDAQEICGLTEKEEASLKKA